MEALIATVVLSIITSLILCELEKNRRERQASIRELEVLNLAKMAYDSKVDRLDLNGISVKIKEDAKGISIFDGEREAIKIEVKD